MLLHINIKRSALEQLYEQRIIDIKTSTSQTRNSCCKCPQDIKKVLQQTKDLLDVENVT